MTRARKTDGVFPLWIAAFKGDTDLLGVLLGLAPDVQGPEQDAGGAGGAYEYNFVRYTERVKEAVVFDVDQRRTDTGATALWQ